MILNGLPDTHQGLAQIGARNPPGPIGLKHLRQGLTQVRPFRLHCQVSQQCTHLTATEYLEPWAV